MVLKRRDIEADCDKPFSEERPRHGLANKNVLSETHSHPKNISRRRDTSGG